MVMQVSGVRSVCSAAFAVICITVLGACGGTPAASHATIVKAQPAIPVPAPDGISVKVSGTSAVVTWGAPKGMSAPLKGYDLYLDQTPSVSLGPQVTSRKLTGLASDSHYVQVVALTANDQSEPVAATFSVAYRDVPPSALPYPEGSPASSAAAAPESAPPVVSPPQSDSAPTTAPVSVQEACTTAVPDFSTVDHDSAAVMRGDDNEVATGHTFGSIIVELQGLSQNLSDRQLGNLIAKGTAAVVDIRNLFIAGGDFMQYSWSAADTEWEAVSLYCSSAGDPLASTA
jgi:hypothetical protein